METNFLAEIHPKVVHFPVALLTTYSLLEIYGIVFKNKFITNTALLILCLAVVSAFFAVLTGNEASVTITGWTDETSALLNTHQQYATYLLWSSILICAFRIFITVKKKLESPVKYIFILTALVILYLVYQTGTYGGNLDDKFETRVDFMENYDQNQMIK